MSRGAKALTITGLTVTGSAVAALVIFLWRQGLERASLWAGIAVLFLTIVIAVSGVWAVWYAARSERSSDQSSVSSNDPPGTATNVPTGKVVFHVTAKRDAYTAQEMTVNQPHSEE